MCHKCCECGEANIPILPLGREYFEFGRQTFYGQDLFCSAECYDKYLDKHFVENYKGYNIYGGVVADGKFRYVPYIGCQYSFDNLEECRKRIDLAKQYVGVY